MQRTNKSLTGSTELKTNRSSYSLIKSLGEGAFGSTELRKSPDGTYHAVKILKDSSQAQALLEEGNFLANLTNKFSQRNSGKPCRFSTGQVEQTIDGSPALFLSFESLYRTADGIPVSQGDTGALLGAINGHFKSTPEIINHQDEPYKKIIQAYHQDPATLGIQLLDSAYQSAAEMHDLNACHLDIALRNLMPRPPQTDSNGNVIKLDCAAIDFGLSRETDAQGNAIKPSTGNLPLRGFDQAAIINQKQSIRTDLYALKTTFLEIMAKNLNIEFTNIVNVTGPGEGMQTYINTRYNLLRNGQTDSELFKKFIKNAELEILANPDPALQRETKIMLDSYYKYLTNPIDATSVPDIKTVRNNDFSVLKECHGKFFERMMEYKLANLDVNNQEQVSQYKESAARLLTLETESTTLKEPYIKLLALEGDALKNKLHDLREAIPEEKRQFYASKENIKETITPDLMAEYKQNPLPALGERELNVIDLGYAGEHQEILPPLPKTPADGGSNPNQQSSTTDNPAYFNSPSITSPSINSAYFNSPSFHSPSSYHRPVTDAGPQQVTTPTAQPGYGSVPSAAPVSTPGYGSVPSDAPVSTPGYGSVPSDAQPNKPTTLDHSDGSAPVQSADPVQHKRNSRSDHFRIDTSPTISSQDLARKHQFNAKTEEEDTQLRKNSSLRNPSLGNS